MRPSASGGGPSVVMGGGVSLEISGYPRPDTDQMIPFKPKLNTNGSYHPVPGGAFWFSFFVCYINFQVI